MRKNNIFVSKSKGELNMKRTIVTLALVTAFVFAFAAVAQATFRGFTPIRPASEVEAGMLQGFITFPEAQVEMDRNFGTGGAFYEDVGQTLQGTAHGGYVTTTTLCVVCHSAHRASGVNPDAAMGDGATGMGAGTVNRANNLNQSFLTAGNGNSCEACHVNTGAQASRLLVEWGPNGGGPHAAPRRGCTMCHNAGIHGLTSSSFNVMNVFMLGNTRTIGEDRENVWPPAAADNELQIRPPLATVAETRDAQITREIQEGRILRGGVLNVPVANSPLSPYRADTTTGTAAQITADENSLWWYNGARSLGPAGTTPPAFGAGVTAGGVQFAAARSLATAFTCGESGCHVDTAMFNLNWGMGFERRDSVRNEVTGANIAQGSPWAAGDPAVVTGHVVPGLRVAGSATSACGPCHAGNPAGFPTASTEVGTRDVSRIAYGCDQCHDMVGVATNTTAWPHGNRNIYVYEWDAAGNQLETMMPAAGGNLWMYGGNIARADSAARQAADIMFTPFDADGNPLAPIPWPAVTLGNNDAGTAARSAFQGPTSANPAFADQRWFVLDGVTGGRYGIIGADNFGGTSGSAAAYTVGTGLVDGSCLKCHVPLDLASRQALNAVGAEATRHAWRGLGGAANPGWNGVAPTNADRLFLYR